MAWSTATFATAPARMSQRLEFEEVYREQADFVYSLSRRLSRGAADAEDLFQEVFVRVYRFLPRFEGGSLRGWLRRIVVNTNTSMKRGKKNQELVHLEETPGWKESVADPERGPLEATEQSEERARIERALQRLTPPFRTILILREVEQLEYAEIASLLEVPVGTVRSRLARARLALRQELEDPHG